MNTSFSTILVRLVESGFAQEALEASSASRATYWDELLWDHLAHARSRKKYSFASAPRSRTRLMEAASRGRVDRLSWLLQRRGVSRRDRDAGAGYRLVSAIDFYGRSALHYALSSHHTECAGLLVKAGAYLIGRDSDFEVPLAHIYAGTVGSEMALSVTQLVLSGQYPADVALKHLMLKYAFMFCQEGCVTALIQAGLVLDAKTIVHWAPPSPQRMKEKLNELIVSSYKARKELGTNPPTYVPMIKVILGVAKTKAAKSAFANFALKVVCLLSDDAAVQMLLSPIGLPCSRMSMLDLHEMFESLVFKGCNSEKYGLIAKMLIDECVEDEILARRLLPMLSKMPVRGARVVINAWEKWFQFSDIDEDPLDFAYCLCHAANQAPHEENDMLEALKACISAEVFSEESKKSMILLLCQMCTYGYVSCVALLLEAVDISAQSRLPSDSNPLWRACSAKQDNVALVELLLAHGISDSTDSPWSLNNTCLQQAACHGLANIVRILLASKDYGLIELKASLSSLFYGSLDRIYSEAVMLDLTKQLYAVWQRAGGIDFDFGVFLYMACRRGYTEIVSYILDVVDKNPSKETLGKALSGASFCDDNDTGLSMVRMLFSRHCAVFDQKSISDALERACMASNIECARLLIDAGNEALVQPTHFNSFFSCDSEDSPVEVWNLLLDHVDDYEKRVGWDAFSQVFMVGWYACAQSLLRVWKPSREYIEKHRTQERDSPFISACSSHNRDGRLLQLLLDYGYGEVEEDVREAFKFACRKRNAEAVRVLLKLPCLRLHSWIEFDTLVYDVPYFSNSESEMLASAEIVEILLTESLQTLDLNSDFEEGIQCAVFDSKRQGPNVEYINALLLYKAKPPLATYLSMEMEASFCDRQRQIPCNTLLRTADALAAVRKAGTETDFLLVTHCAKREVRERKGTIPALQALVLSGADVNARKKDKPVIYLAAAKHYDPVLISFMLQSGAEFDAAALVKCVTRERKYELRSLIDAFSTMQH